MRIWTIAAVCLLAASISACAISPRNQPEPEHPASSAVSSAPKPKLPPAEVRLSGTEIALGETLVLYVKGAESATAKTDLPHQPIFYPNGDELTALLPVAYTTPVGNYELSIQAGESDFHYTISVEEREFEIQNLTMDEDTANSTNTDEANLEWEETIEPLKLTGEPVKYWDGAFTQPVQGQVTTEYGTIRYTNGSTVAERHGGIDLAAATGTQTVAANAGKIQFAGFLQLTGNTVVIEHGFGLKSFYYHMDSLDVATDDLVKAGDPIGKVGTTGYSTGPHLHYALLVNDIFINPWTAFESGIE